MNGSKREQDGTLAPPQEEETPAMASNTDLPQTSTSRSSCARTPSLQASFSAQLPLPMPLPLSISREIFEAMALNFYEDLSPPHVYPTTVLLIESKEMFDEALTEAGDKLVVVDFSASWCGPCQTMAPHFEMMSEKHKESVVFLKVDVDDVPDVADEYDIAAMPTFVFIKNGVKDLAKSNGVVKVPTFIFFKNGNKIDEVKGAYKEELKAKLEELKC
ncbi:thioredoxin H-type-like isoform X2 [Rhinatrema bivittatum]|nr:thioredoxin H-type-like isoform X2 [Rhinatrema bivittatum]